MDLDFVSAHGNGKKRDVAYIQASWPNKPRLFRGREKKANGVLRTKNPREPFMYSLI